MEILDRRRETLVGRERALLESLMEYLVGFGAPVADVDLIRRALEEVEELFLLVVAGEPDSGKAAFVDALAGDDLSEGDDVETITFFKHGHGFSEKVQREGVVEKARPSDALRGLSIVDMPVTDAVVRRRAGAAELGQIFAARSDLVLYVVPAGRPLSASGLGYLKLIRDWGKKVVLVVDDAEFLNGAMSEERAGEVRARFGDDAKRVLGVPPPVFFVSSPLARKAKSAAGGAEREAMLKESGFTELEAHIGEVLDEEDRVRLKLEGPLGVIQMLSIRYQFAMDERIGLLDGDLKTYEQVEAQLDGFRETMVGEFAARTSEIETIISRMNGRADRWFDRNVRLGNVANLARSERTRERFQREVVAVTEALVNERVAELVDWMVDRNLRQWRAMVGYFNNRRQADYDERLMGEISDGFEYDRDRLLSSVGGDVARIVRDHDRHRESEQIARSLRNAAARAAAAEAGAFGLGAASIAAISTAASLASTLTLGTMTVLLAGLGFMTLPNRRRGVREEFRAKTGALREKLVGAVRGQLDAELESSVSRMREAISLYGRFVRSEQARVSDARNTLDELNAEVETLKEEISAPVARSGGPA